VKEGDYGESSMYSCMQKTHEKTVLKKEWGGIKEKDGGYTVSTFVNVTMYPSCNYNMLINQKIKKNLDSKSKSKWILKAWANN
jgi:hypothetical protein